MINVKYRGGLREKLGCAQESIQAGSVKDVLAHIKAGYGREAYKEAGSMLITVDGINIQLLRRYDTKLQDGMEVSFLPLCGGG